MELRDLSRISLSAKQPDSNMTDVQWQEYFAIMKSMVKPSKDRKMKSTGARIVVNGLSVSSAYYGETNYTRYCQFINSVLHTIRGNRLEPATHDYCFYIYQIADLLKYEHDNLRAVWRQQDKCFEVWLEK